MKLHVPFLSACIALLVLSSCDNELVDWIEKHIPAPKAYDQHQDISAFNLHLQEGVDNSRFIYPRIVTVAIAFDLRTKEIVNIGNLDGRSLYLEGFYHKEQALDWFSDA